MATGERRLCLIFRCPVYGDQRCCAGCPLREGGCTHGSGPCRNDPERCGQVDKVSEPPKELERRALEVAARVMEAAGLCRHRDRAKCQRLIRSPEICEKCLAAWCMTKARQLAKEERDCAIY